MHPWETTNLEKAVSDLEDFETDDEGISADDWGFRQMATWYCIANVGDTNDTGTGSFGVTSSRDDCCNVRTLLVGAMYTAKTVLSHASMLARQFSQAAGAKNVRSLGEREASACVKLVHV